MMRAFVAVSVMTVAAQADGHGDRHHKRHGGSSMDDRHAFDGKGELEGDTFRTLSQACERSAQNYCYEQYETRDVAGMLACVKKEKKTEPYCTATFTHKLPALYACIEDVQTFCPELLRVSEREERDSADSSDDSSDDAESSDFEIRRRLLSNHHRDHDEEAPRDPRMDCLEMHYDKFNASCTAAVNAEYLASHEGQTTAPLEGVLRLLSVPDHRGGEDDDNHHHFFFIGWLGPVLLVALAVFIYRRRKRRKRHAANVAHAAAQQQQDLQPGLSYPGTVAPAHPVHDAAPAQYHPYAAPPVVVVQGTPPQAQTVQQQQQMYPVLQGQPVAAPGQHFTVN